MKTHFGLAALAWIVFVLVVIPTAPAAPSGSQPEVAPSPQAGAIGEPLAGAAGWATWYDDGPGLYGAVHSWKWGDDPYPVEVCRLDNAQMCVTVIVRDYCACGDRRGVPTVIDLSPAAFRKIASLHSGVVRVTVSGPVEITLPATDTE